MDEDMSTDFELEEASMEIPDDTFSEIPEDIPEDVPEDVPEESSPEEDYDVLEDVPEDVPEDVSEESSPEGDYDVLEDIPEDVPEDVSEESSPEGDYDVLEDIPEDVSEDSSPEEDHDVWEDIPEDVPEDVSEDLSPEEDHDVWGGIPEDVPVDVPEDIPEDVTEDVPADEQPADNQSDVVGEVPAGETEDTTPDAIADEQPADSQDKGGNEMPTDESEGQECSQCPKCGKSMDQCTCTGDDGDAIDNCRSGDAAISETEDTADEQPTDAKETEAMLPDDARNDTPPNQAEQETKGDQPVDSQKSETDIPTNTETEDMLVDTNNESSSDAVGDEHHGTAESSAFDQLSDYMNRHNYGQQDYDTYSQDPEWQALHQAAFPEAHEDASCNVPAELPEETPVDAQEPKADTTADTEEHPANATEQMAAEHLNDFLETESPVDTVSAGTQKPRIDNLDNRRGGEGTESLKNDLPNSGPVSNALNALSDYMNEHDYSAQDYSVYSQDPEWRALHREAFPDSELPPLTQENAFNQLSEYMNRHNYGQQDYDTYSQDPAWRELERAAFPEYELPPIRSKEYASILEKMDDAKVAYRPVESAVEQRSETDIINELGGGDLTEGSCSSLAFAYAGNKAGYNVLDFRDGNSRSFFSENSSIQTIASLPGVDSRISYGTNDIACANNLLSGMEGGKEYYLATGLHAAIVKKAEDGYQFLELQSPNRNGWKPLDNDALTYRFGCSSDSGYELPNFLIDVDSLGRSNEFRNVLGYINTAGNNQLKGGEGRVR